VGNISTVRHLLDVVVQQQFLGQEFENKDTFKTRNSAEKSLTGKLSNKFSFLISSWN
jgi:hypothetical protein